MKKLLSVLLLVLLFAFLCAPASAEEPVYTEGYFYFTVEDDSITIVGYFGSETEVTVPASIAGIPVNTIAPGAFDGTPVTKLYLPDTITSYESGSSQIEIVFDANTDHPLETGEISPVTTEEGLPSDSRDDAEVDPITAPTAAPRPEESAAPAETAPTPGQETAPEQPAPEDPAPAPEQPAGPADDSPEKGGEPGASPSEPAAGQPEQKTASSGPVIALLLGLAAGLGAAVIVRRKKK